VHPARRLWLVVEPIHAVTYFCDERADAAAALGLRGFWRTYFAFRAAPLGRVDAGVVTAAFANFAPSMVERAVPGVWDVVEPSVARDARAEAAAASMRRLAPGVVDAAARDLVVPFRSALASLPSIGRPMFAANAAVGFDDPVAELWQCCTCAREHRGDGHVAALVARGIDGCEAHVLAAAASGVDAALLRDNRGWSTDDWAAATDRLVGRGLVTGDGNVTVQGRAVHAEVEAATDELASQLVAQLDDVAEQLQARLGAVADAVAASGEIPFPNPMGLPRRDSNQVPNRSEGVRGMSQRLDAASRDFDFLHGTWTVEHHRLRERLVGSSDWETFTGTAKCWEVLDGFGNVDEIAMPARGAVGMTVRLLDRRSGLWSLHWASSLTGAFEPPVTGGFEGGVGRFFGDDTHDGRPIRVRYVWDEITSTSARWQQAFSADGGATWEPNWVMVFTRSSDRDDSNPI
jgi:Helix-turn-helix family